MSILGRLRGKTALITGGNTGIGRSIALAFAREGADVAIAWIDREAEAESLVAEIEALGEEVRRRVALTSGIALEWEIKVVGRPA